MKEGTLDDLDSEYEIVKDVTKNSEFTGLKFELKNEKPFYADVVLQETFPAITLSIGAFILALQFLHTNLFLNNLACASGNLPIFYTSFSL